MDNLSCAFDSIYTEGQWGKRLSSGPGSWHSPLVEAYVDCVSNFIKSQKLSGVSHAIDLGCGDFNVGSKLLNQFASVKAIDISPEIIQYCNKKFKQPEIEFICGDGRSLPLGSTDILFIRQVFQHLSNADIQRVLRNAEKSCTYMLLTEHIPAGSYTPNIDIPSGTPHTRLSLNSGVNIMHEPFFHSFQPITEILTYLGFGGSIKTTAYLNRQKADSDLG